MIAIIDYGMGNLKSVKKALEFIGQEAVITNDAEVIKAASHVILPGVGAAKDAMDALHKTGLYDVAKEEAASGKPFLGICLGMQLMFEYSEEGGHVPCLGIVKGHVKAFELSGMRVPHMGWNDIKTADEDIYGKENPYVYFVHSFHAADVPAENVIATCTYGYEFCAAVRDKNVVGMQYHPEKSGAAGIEMLRRFCAM